VKFHGPPGAREWSDLQADLIVPGERGPGAAWARKPVSKI
jgi:hypothetical protein